MKKWFIIIFIFLLIIAGLAGTGLYFSRVVISKGDNVYIKTAFRPMEKYETEGTYFFPEKLIFWNKDSFTMFKPELAKEYKKDIKITLPAIPQFNDKPSYEIVYELSVNYTISNKKQLELFKDNKYKSYVESFQNWLDSRDKHLVFQKVLLEINNKSLSNLDPIFEQARKELFDEIQKKYQGENIELTEGKISHSTKEAPSFELYLNRYEEAKKHDQEKLKLKSKEDKEKLESEAVWNAEKRKIEQHIERLQMYGKLFKEYPEALNYLYLQKLSDRVNIIVAPKDTKSIFAPLLPNNDSKKGENKTVIPEALKGVIKNNLEKKDSEKNSKPEKAETKSSPEVDNLFKNQ